MEKLPHTYQVSCHQEANLIRTDTEQAPSLLAGAPPQFGGSPDNWSPETLLLASIGQCLFLTFVSITKGSKFDFSDYSSSVSGVLEKTGSGLAFTSAQISVSFKANDEEKAATLIHKAEQNCLITNSVKFPVTIAFSLKR